MDPGKPLSKKIIEVCAASVILGLVPIVFVYDLLYVLPDVYTTGNLPYICYIVCEIFLFANLESNFIVCKVTNTNVDYQRLPKSVCNTDERKSWTRYCKSCNQLCPPGSYHCKSCGVCILKRHHHCIFTGCCIGHRNQRYFVFFLMYFFAISVLSLSYSILSTFPTHVFLLKLTFFELIQIAAINLKIASALLSGGMLLYYLPVVLLSGGISYENHNSNEVFTRDKNMYRNLKRVCGERVYVAWISPMVHSELPEDGYN